MKRRGRGRGGAERGGVRRGGLGALARSGGAIVVFGGSFDPVHRWHTRVAGAARRRAGAGAWVVFVPAARSPHKDARPRASDEDRVAMLERAIRGMKRSVVWTEEIDRARRRPGEPSYTAETLRRLRREVGAGRRLYVLIGEDQAAAFHRWKAFREIMRMAEVLVVRRPGAREDLGAVLRASGAWTEEEIGAWMARVVRAPESDASSTAARAAAEAGAWARLRRLVKPGVADYIRVRGLYGKR